MDDRASLVRYPARLFVSEFCDIDGRPLRHHVEALLADPSQRPLLDALAASLAANGSFRSPVLVDFASWRLLNGHHRTAVAWQAGELIWACDRDDELTCDLDVEFVVAPLERLGPVTETDATELLCVLRSFPVGPGWAEADVISVRHHERVSGCFMLSSADPTEFSRELVAVGRRHGFEIRALAIAPSC